MGYLPHHYDTDPCKMRNRELIEMFVTAYKLVSKRKFANPRKQALAWVLNNGKPHYHVGYGRAHIVLSNLNNGKIPFNIKGSADEMWSEIKSRVEQAQSVLGLSRSKAIAYVLENCRASRFFIRPATAKKIVYTWIKNHPHSFKC